MHKFYWNALVSAAEEAQQGISFIGANLYDGSRYGSKFSRKAGIEADHSGQAKIARTRREGQGTAQAKAGDEGGAIRSITLTQVGKCGVYIGSEACCRHLLH